MDQVDITVIGAGVVGLAVAAALAKAGRDVVVLERHAKHGQETSSRNSEVIHAGIYYPSGTLKAAFCVEGARRLYAFCEEHEVPHARLGKLIVAADESEVATLESLMRQGQANGVPELRLITGEEARRLEPNVNAVAALHSPATGILSVHALMDRLHAIAESRGAMFVFGCEVRGVEPVPGGYELKVAGEEYSLHSRGVVNCAGLQSDQVAALAGLDPDAAGCRLRYCKGSYFSYQKKSPVSRLVYPVPQEHLTGLGIHATLDLGGCLRFGPDTEFVERLDYDVDPVKGDPFFQGACKIIRGLQRDALVPGMAGVRPRLAGEGVRDFVIRHEANRGLPGWINLVGIESPGLTGCLSIAERVGALAAEAL